MFDLIDNDKESILGVDESLLGDGSAGTFKKIAEKYKDKLPKGYLSISQIVKYMRCGEAYYYQYVLQQPSPSSYYQVQGRGVHKAAETLHLRLIDQQPVTEEELVQVYSDLHDKEIVEVPFDLFAQVTQDEEDIEDAGRIKDVGILMTRKYFRVAMGYEPGIAAVRPIAAERIFNVELPIEDGEKLPFVGVIDLEEEDGISDLKTKKKAASQLDADNSLQLSIYAHVTTKPKVRLDQIVKPTKKLPVRYIRTESIRTRPEVLHALDVVSEVADDIARGRFRKTNPENWWCNAKWCPYWTSCRGKAR